MENNEEDEKELDEEIEKLDKKEQKSLIRLRQMFKRAVQGTRAQVKVTRVLISMARATRYSQDAQKLFFDKNNQEKAESMLIDGIKMIDDAIIDFPAQGPALMPLKEKMAMQLKDMEYQKKGIIKSEEDLKAEVYKS
jgi:hypothetical protein